MGNLTHILVIGYPPSWSIKPSLSVSFPKQLTRTQRAWMYLRRLTSSLAFSCFSKGWTTMTLAFGRHHRSTHLKMLRSGWMLLVSTLIALSTSSSLGWLSGEVWRFSTRRPMSPSASIHNSLLNDCFVYAYVILSPGLWIQCWNEMHSNSSQVVRVENEVVEIASLGTTSVSQQRSVRHEFLVRGEA